MVGKFGRMVGFANGQKGFRRRRKGMRISCKRLRILIGPAGGSRSSWMEDVCFLYHDGEIWRLYWLWKFTYINIFALFLSSHILIITAEAWDIFQLQSTIYLNLRHKCWINIMQPIGNVIYFVSYFLVTSQLHVIFLTPISTIVAL